MGVVKDYDIVVIKQTSNYIKMSCENYIHCLSKTHGLVLADDKYSSSTAATAASVETLTLENDPWFYNRNILLMYL